MVRSFLLRAAALSFPFWAGACAGPRPGPVPAKKVPISARARFTREKKVEVLEELVTRLAASKDPADREEALWAVHDHRGKVALLAVRGLARARDRRLIPHLFDRLRDPSAPGELRLACLDAFFAFPPSLWRERLKVLLPALEPAGIRKAASEVLDSTPPQESHEGP